MKPIVRLVIKQQVRINKKEMSYFRHIGFWLILAAGMFLNSCASPIKELYPEDKSLRPVTIYVVSHGWHTGIVAHHEDVEEFLPEHPEMPTARYLMFEWGDGKYFPHPDPGTGLLLRAALWPTKSVIQVTGMDVRPQNYFRGSTVVRVQVTQEGIQNLGQFIGRRFRLDESGQAIVAAGGLYRNSIFFEATGRYYIPKTSNTWTARALRQTGYPITPLFAQTSGNVIKQALKDGEEIGK